MLAEVLQKSVSDVIQPVLGLHDARCDQEFQKLQFHVRAVYMTRNWFSHDFSVTILECQHAIVSLVELCCLLRQRLNEPSVVDGLDSCADELQTCLSSIDKLQVNAVGYLPMDFFLRIDQVATLLLLRCFERLCAAAEEKGGPLFNSSSTHYNKECECMRFSDVVDVIAEMKKPSTKMGRVIVADYEFVIRGRNMLFHGTQRDTSVAMLFCCGAVGRLLRFLGSSADAARAKIVDEILAVCQHLHLHDEDYVLRRIAESQGVHLPTSHDLSEISWLRCLLWSSSSEMLSCLTIAPHSMPKMPKESCSARFHESLLRFEHHEIATYCTGQMKDFKTRGSLVLPASDTTQNKHRRCDMLLAAVALSSLTPCAESFGGIEAEIDVAMSSVEGKRAPEQRDEFFTGRSVELMAVCNCIRAVLLNSRLAGTPAHVAVMGLPGTGKSLLVSQALLKMQTIHASEQRDVYFLKLRGRGAASVEEDLVVHARSLGSKIDVSTSCTPIEALSKLKSHLGHSRFVAIIDDANADGLRAAADWIPVSTALHALLVTSQQPAEELAAIEISHGLFEKVDLLQFDLSTSVDLITKICSRCPAIITQTDCLQDIAGCMDNLPLGVRLFAEWCQSQYQRHSRALRDDKKRYFEAAKIAADAACLPYDPAVVDLQFRDDCLTRTCVCDEFGVAQRIFREWMSDKDVSDKQVLQSTSKHPRGLIGTVRLVLLEFERLPLEDANACSQLLSILAMCPSNNTPWSLFLGHDCDQITGLEHVTHREGLLRCAILLQRSGLVQVLGEFFSMHQLLQRVIRQENPTGLKYAVNLVGKRLPSKVDIKAANHYRGMLPAAYHIVKEVMVISDSNVERPRWCSQSRLHIAQLTRWLGGGLLEIDIWSAIKHEMENEREDLQYENALKRLTLALIAYGRVTDALDLLEQELAFCQTTYSADHRRITDSMLGVADCYIRTSRYDAVLDLYLKVLDSHQRTLPADDIKIAHVLGLISDCYSKLGRREEALNLGEQSLAFIQRVLPGDHRLVAATMLNVSSILFVHFDASLAKAHDLSVQALAMFQRVLPVNQLDIVTALEATADIRNRIQNRNFGKIPGSDRRDPIELLKQALAICQLIFPAEHPRITKTMLAIEKISCHRPRGVENPDFAQEALNYLRRTLPEHQDTALAMVISGDVLLNVKRQPSEALALHEEAMTLLHRLQSDHSSIPVVMLRIADCYRALGRHTEALDVSKQALAFARRVFPADRDTLERFMSDLIDRYLRLNCLDEAINLQEERLGFLQRILGPDDWKLAHAMKSASGMYFHLSSPTRVPVIADYSRKSLWDKRAIDLSERAFDIYSKQRALPADDPNIGFQMVLMASDYHSAGRKAEGLAMWDQVLAHERRLLGNDDPKLGDCMQNVALMYECQGHHTKALELNKELLALRLRLLPADDTKIANTMEIVAETCTLLRHFAEALDLQEQALAFYQRVLSFDDIRVAKSMCKTADCYEKLGRNHEALRLDERALNIFECRCPQPLPMSDADYLVLEKPKIARRYSAVGRHSEAIKLLEQAKLYWFCYPEKDQSRNQKTIANVMIQLGESLCAAGRDSEAVSCQEQLSEFLDHHE